MVAVITPAIETVGLRKAYGRTVALESLDIRVDAGEVFGFLGPNGAGKTTAVKLLLGLTRPTAGSGTVLGRPLGDLEARRRIGYLPELFRYQAWLTAREVLGLHARLAGLDAARRRVGGRAGARARRASRAAAATGWAASARGCSSASASARPCSATRRSSSSTSRRPPSIPWVATTSGRIIREAQARGSAVLLNSHLLGEVERLCDRVAIVNRGTGRRGRPAQRAPRPGGRPHPGHGPAAGPVGPRRVRGPRGRRRGLARRPAAWTRTASRTSSRRSSLPAAGSTPSTPAGASLEDLFLDLVRAPDGPGDRRHERRGSCWSIAALTLARDRPAPGRLGARRSWRSSSVAARRVGDASGSCPSPATSGIEPVELQIGVSQVLILIAFMFSFVLAMSAAFLARAGDRLGRRDGRRSTRCSRGRCAARSSSSGRWLGPVDRRRRRTRSLAGLLAIGGRRAA